MKARLSALLVLLAMTGPARSEETAVSIFRDFLVPPSLFREKATGKSIDPRRRLAAEGLALRKDDSLTYDPATSRLFVRAGAPVIHGIEKLIASEIARGSARVLVSCRILETDRPLLSGSSAEAEPARIVRVFAGAGEVEALLRNAAPAPSSPEVSLTVRSGEPAEANIGETLTRVVPAISADFSTVELDLSLGRDPAGLKLAVPSGGSVAVEERLGETARRLRIVTASLVDPAGKPLSGKEVKGLPGGEGSDLAGALFPGPVPVPALEKVGKIVLPSIEFRETPLSEAIAILERASRDHDATVPEALRGVRIRYFHTGLPGIEERPVTFHLTNIPLIDAVLHTAAAAGCEFRIEGGVVLIGPFLASHAEGAEETWYAAFLAGKEAGRLAAEGKGDAAATKRREALTLLETLRERHPEFFPEAVAAEIRRWQASPAAK